MADETATQLPRSRVDDLATLLPRFDLESFRPGQDEVVNAVASGADVMCVMPTGGGKSLCYQLPSLAREGTTIVVSPLIALMKDQVDALQQLGIQAELLNSTLTLGEQSDVMMRMTAGELELVYVAPERLRNQRFLDVIRKSNVTLLAIDEAHCVSEWGHDFRPDYSRLGIVRERFLPGVQTIALTATATPMVRDDVIASLKLKSPKTFVTGFARTNLHFSVDSVKTDTEKQDALTRYLDTQDGAGIIYAATRKGCEELAEWLPEQIARPVAVYHAGLDPNSRRGVQEAFMAGEYPIIVATNAFGMGIDKSDIRFVVHFNMPGTLEAYYQEAGRAGRDGLDSDCRLLFSYQDRYLQEFFIDTRYPSRETIQKVHRYLLSRKEDPIELTLDQVRDAIDVKDSTESIGAAETLLARAGVIRRLDAASNSIMVRIDSDAPTMLDFLPREAKRRRQVMSVVEKMVGRRRGEDVYLRPQKLMAETGLDRHRLANALRDLRGLKSFDYVPPFRGRAVCVQDRDTKFDDLDIDFTELDRRKAAELEKLESVINFARTGSCRQSVILDYFGESDAPPCGSCDRCDDVAEAADSPGGIAPSIVPEGVEPEMLLRGIQVILSGVTRMHGRFGRNLIAQMLCGSKNKKLQGLHLNRLSTYGLLGTLKQGEIVDVLDVLSSAGLVESVEVEQRRPTIQISEAGRRVMHRSDPVPASCRLSFPLAKKLALAASRIEASDVQTSSAGTDDIEPETDEPVAPPTANEQLIEDLAERLKRWRRKTSAAHDIPAYRVLTNAVIERLSEQMPQSTEALETVNGIGSATIEQFGYDVVELIRQTLSEAEIAESDAQESSPEDRSDDGESPETLPPESSQSGDGLQSVPATNTADSANLAYEPDRDGGFLPQTFPAEPIEPADPIEIEKTTDTSASVPVRSDAYWTWRLFDDGYSSEEISHIRDRDPIALAEDLRLAVAEGLRVRQSWLAEPEVGG